MTSFRSIALSYLLIMANANEENHACSLITPVTCNVDIPLTVSSYDMYNGGAGIETYFDDLYSSPDSPSGPSYPYEYLSGGTGDLTDGFIAENSWDYTTTAIGSPPYVGWQVTKAFPETNEIPITFKFGQGEIISKVKISVDNPDMNGYSFSGSLIGAPESVKIGGTKYDFPPNPSFPGPYTATIKLDEPIYLAAGVGLDVKLMRDTDDTFICGSPPDPVSGSSPVASSSCLFIFVSEVQFFSQCSPTFLECVDQERAHCCYKTESSCGGRRELQDASGMRKLFMACFWGDEVYSKQSTDLCLEECSAYGVELCLLKEKFGLLQECDDSWWTLYDGKP